MDTFYLLLFMQKKKYEKWLNVENKQRNNLYGEQKKTQHIDMYVCNRTYQIDYDKKRQHVRLRIILNSKGYTYNVQFNFELNFFLLFCSAFFRIQFLYLQYFCSFFAFDFFFFGYSKYVCAGSFWFAFSCDSFLRCTRQNILQ